MDKTYAVTFAGTGSTVQVEAGTTLLAAAQEARATRVVCCGLTPPCGRCRVAIHEGDEHLTRPEALEVETRERYVYLPYERVGCLARVEGDIVVELRKNGKQ